MKCSYGEQKQACMIALSSAVNQGKLCMPIMR